MFTRNSFGVLVAGLILAGCVQRNDERLDPAGELPQEFVATYPKYLAEIALETEAATSANASVGDLNNDGHLDIVLAKGRHWPLRSRILFGDGAGGFTAPADLSEIADRSYSGSLVDMDLDGDLDIVVSNDRPDPGIVYLNDGTGVFTVGSRFGKAEWPTRNASVADINGDGLVDVITANRYGANPGGNYICFNEGNAVFSADCYLFSTESSTTITPADLNDDGLVDLVVPHRDGGQGFVYLQIDGDEVSFMPTAFGPSDAVMRASRVADFNNDGIFDIVAINAGMSEGDDGLRADRKQASGVSLFLGETNSQFSTAIPVGDLLSIPYAIEIGDLNLDGTVDIVVGHVEAPSVVYFNNKFGAGFTAVEFGDGEGTVYGFGLGDLNEDGQPDIVEARSGAVNVVHFGAPAGL